MRLVQRLAHSYQITLPSTDCERLVEAIGWPQPYYLQLAFNGLRDRLSIGGISPGAAVDHALAELVEPGVDNDFHHWEQRLKRQLDPDDAALAGVLLTRACATPKGARPDVLLLDVAGHFPNLSAAQCRVIFVRVRDILIRDAYWRIHDADGERSYRFCLEPLRRWWLRRLSP
jgi:hypothetical protein